ncbi:MAG TPA: pseudouridine synthase [Thermoanaerobaculia bacterium]|nr:pseudouridine synthase [Thermoanaerobaculia bacterium]
MSEERVQRILARAGIASRRKAEELIREARVTVNGQVAEIGGKADPAKDAIKVDGKRIHPHEGPYRYLLLNKPRGVMSTVSDPQERKTVMDFVPPTLRKALVPVGRLDFDSEGLILLTDDGEFAQHVAHPRYGGSKTYEVKVKGEPSAAQLDLLREGIVLEGERTAPARITRRTKGPQRRRGGDDDEGHNSWWIVELTQGRTRQIREMFLRIGHPVQKLRRVAIGPLRDPHLLAGAVRELTEREVETLRRITARPKKKKKEGPHPRPLSRERERGEQPASRTAAAPAKKRAPAKKKPLSVKRAAQGEPARKAPAKKAPPRKAGVKRAPAKRSPAKKGGPGGGRRP